MRSRLRPRLNHTTVVAYLALFVALGGGALAASKSFVDSNGQLHACVSKKGKVKLVKSAKSKCPKKNSKVAWSQTGPAGKPGTPGKTGPQGPGAISLNVPAYNGTTYKTVATVGGLDLKLRCGSFVSIELAPSAPSPGGVLAEGYESQNDAPPQVDDTSSATYTGNSDTDFLNSLIARPANISKWTHFDLIAHRDAGDNSCTLRGMIIPPS
jgi:hypothetical protein